MYTSIAAICAAILFPLLAFGAINEFFGRIVIVAIVGGMIALWASNGPSGHEYLIEPRDGWKCAVLYVDSSFCLSTVYNLLFAEWWWLTWQYRYFGFMSIAAILIS